MCGKVHKEATTRNAIGNMKTVTVQLPGKNQFILQVNEHSHFCFHYVLKLSLQSSLHCNFFFFVINFEFKHFKYHGLLSHQNKIFCPIFLVFMRELEEALS